MFFYFLVKSSAKMVWAYPHSFSEKDHPVLKWLNILSLQFIPSSPPNCFLFGVSRSASSYAEFPYLFLYGSLGKVVEQSRIE